MAVTTLSPPVEKSATVPLDLIWRLSVDQYHAMIEAGILTADDPVELLNGWLVAKMSKKPPHRLTTELTREALAHVIPTGWHVNAQEPITTADSEPEPDVVVVRGGRRDYLDRHPGPHDVALVVEVADTSLEHDQGLKKRLYALAGIPVYWIANLCENQFEMYTDPSGSAPEPDYHQRQVYGPSDEIPVIIEGVEVGRIPVRELLP